MKKLRGVILISTAAIALLAAGCTKKSPTAANTPPPLAAQAPTQPAAPPSTPPQRLTPPATRADNGNNGPRMPDAATRARIDELLGRIEDAYFDYNQHTLRPDAIKALQADSTELRDIIVQYPAYHLTIEGHADERGSEEYNLALGNARAKAARDYLAQVGIPEAQLSVVSYGKDKPICDQHDEACWQKNRRIHITAAPAR